MKQADAPDLIRVAIRRNASAAPGGSVDASYATGDEVCLATDSVSGSVIAAWSNATSIGYSQFSAPPNIPLKDGSSNNFVSATYWGLVFYAHWL